VVCITWTACTCRASLVLSNVAFAGTLVVDTCCFSSCIMRWPCCDTSAGFLRAPTYAAKQGTLLGSGSSTSACVASILKQCAPRIAVQRGTAVSA
jgi:hypothetical protein